MPTQQQLNKLADELFWYAYGVHPQDRHPLTANDPRAPNWRLARHFAEQHWSDDIAMFVDFGEYMNHLWETGQAPAPSTAFIARIHPAFHPPLPGNVPVTVNQDTQHVGHWLLPLALGIPAGAMAGHFATRWLHEHGHGQHAAHPTAAPSHPVSGGPWESIVGGHHGHGGGQEFRGSAAYRPWLSITNADEPQRFVKYGPWNLVIGTEPWLSLIGDDSMGGVAPYGALAAWSEQFGPQQRPSVSGAPWESIVGGGPWMTIVGAALDVLRQQAHAAADTLPGRVVGALRAGNGRWVVRQFRSPDDADDWFGSATHDPGTFNYAAYFDKSDVTYPMPLNEKVGRASSTAVSGDGSDERAHARALATGKAGQAVGVIHTADGLWYSFAFHSLDDADDWYGHAISNPSSYTYAAYFDKDASGVAFVANESVGGGRRSWTPGQSIRRGIATTD